jgi:hypothetical protein
MFDVVTRPQCGEALAGDAELADEFHQFAVGRFGAEQGAHTGGVAPYALDPDNADRLWQISRELIH